VFSSKPYEGRQQADFNINKSAENIAVPAGTFIIKTNQRTLRVIVNLLEPMAPDSLARWGFFNAFFERKEYAEDYVMEPIAKKMLRANSKLKAKFIERLISDEKFGDNPAERLDFFYRNSPFFDKNEKIYPIMRTFEQL
jgi:hypothetical protein